MKKAKVDVIIPTYRPSASLRTLLRRLSAQTVRPAHILLINTEEEGWDPGYADGIRGAEVFHIEKENFDHGGTRNAGRGLSAADYVLYLTQDAMPKDPYLIANLLKAFRDPKVKIAYGRQLPAKGCRVVEGFTREFNYPPKSRVKTLADLDTLGIKTYFCSNVCAMYDRAFLQKNGGFPEPCIFNEDMIFAGKAMKRGAAVAYCADARVIHSHNYTKMQQFRRNFDNGVSQALHPEIFRGIRSEGEGKRLVRETTAFLRSHGMSHLIPGFYAECFMRYLGFKLGQHFRSLPKRVVRFCTMNQGFWQYRGRGDTLF